MDYSAPPRTFVAGSTASGGVVLTGPLQQSSNVPLFEGIANELGRRLDTAAEIRHRLSNVVNRLLGATPATSGGSVGKTAEPNGWADRTIGVTTQIAEVQQSTLDDLYRLEVVLGI